MSLHTLIPPVNITAGKAGNAEISHFTVSKEQAEEFNFLKLLSYQPGRNIEPGSYTRLHIDGQIMMSDTPAEKRDHLEPVYRARGHCFVNGLGLGMVANAMACKPEVDRVTVVENNPHVIALVAGSLHPKVEVIEADAFTYAPPPRLRYGVVWHDIWFSISLDDNEERTRLKRRYARRWTHYHGAWGDHDIERMKREDRRRGGWW